LGVLGFPCSVRRQAAGDGEPSGPCGQDDGAGQEEECEVRENQPNDVNTSSFSQMPQTSPQHASSPFRPSRSRIKVLASTRDIIAGTLGYLDEAMSNAARRYQRLAEESGSPKLGEDGWAAAAKSVDISAPVISGGSAITRRGSIAHLRPAMNLNTSRRNFPLRSQSFFRGVRVVGAAARAGDQCWGAVRIIDFDAGEVAARWLRVAVE
jgi:hypothetical protein